MFRTSSRLTLVAALTASFGIARAEEPPPEAPPAEAPPAEAPPEETPPPKPPEARKATVKGTVKDKTSGEGMPAAAVQVKGGADGDKTIATELDGTYTLSLAPGTYTIIFSTPEYIEETRKVTVAEDQVVDLTLSLAPTVKATAKVETIEVSGALDTRKDTAIIAERRSAATVTDAIGAQQISRSPDSNASDAAKRMVAATIQDNRYIVVRGLGGRYSMTLLNGVPLPSPDPDVPAAPLDLFPASLITNLTVQKTFSPDMFGNFAGGALGIETRSYPTKLTVKARIGMGNDSQSSFRSFNGQTGGGTFDLLGFDDGARALPTTIPGDKLAGDPSLSTAARNAEVAAFRNNWTISDGTAGPNLTLGASVGDTVKIGGKRVGYFAGLNFGHNYIQRKSRIARVGGDDGMGGRLPSVLQLDDTTSIEQANLGTVVGAGLRPAPGHKIDVFGMYVHTGDLAASQVTGTDASTAIIDRTRLQFLQRELLFTQALGESKLGKQLFLEWQGNVARVGQDEPDTRDLLRTQAPDGRFAIATTSGSGDRLFGDLTDTTLGGAVAARYQPSAALRFKVGTAIQRSARVYQQRRFHFTVSGDDAFLSPDEAFSPDHAGTSMSMFEVTVPSDGYTATRTVGGVFAMTDVNPTKKLRLVGGARFEASRLDVGLDSKVDLMVPPMPSTKQNDNNILPSLNAVYSLGDATNLRAAYAMTVARANFREIAPSLYFDYVRRRVIGGNPNLRQTSIHNGDLRLETFLGDSELLAASVFAKHFVDPIERVVEAAGDGDNVGFANSPTAQNYGLELEARISLARLSPALKEFSVGGNLSLINSRIDIGDGQTRRLQGQSGYVANLGLGYESRATKTRVDLLYNSFGRRIEEVGTGGAGNIFEEPFHRLDLTVSQPLPRNLRAKLAGGNLLNQRVVRTQDGVEILAFQVGVTVIGSLEFSLE